MLEASQHTGEELLRAFQSMCCARLLVYGTSNKQHATVVSNLLDIGLHRLSTVCGKDPMGRTHPAGCWMFVVVLLVVVLFMQMVVVFACVPQARAHIYLYTHTPARTHTPAHTYTKCIHLHAHPHPHTISTPAYPHTIPSHHIHIPYHPIFHRSTSTMDRRQFPANPQHGAQPVATVSRWPSQGWC